VSADQRVTAAHEYLAGARRRKVDQLPPSLLMRECAELRRLLGQVLDVLAGGRDRDAARRLAEIREVFRHFDWEYHDRQLALEEIERIALAGPNGGP
jgi:hypothetical protein